MFIVIGKETLGEKQRQRRAGKGDYGLRFGV